MDLLLNNSENFGKSKRLGGATRDRTADLLHAMQALSQLSYNPENECYFIFQFSYCQHDHHKKTYFVYYLIKTVEFCINNILR